MRENHRLAPRFSVVCSLRIPKLEGVYPLFRLSLPNSVNNTVVINNYGGMVLIVHRGTGDSLCNVPLRG